MPITCIRDDCAASDTSRVVWTNVAYLSKGEGDEIHDRDNRDLCQPTVLLGFAEKDPGGQTVHKVLSRLLTSP